MSTLTTPTGGTDCVSLLSLQLCHPDAVLFGDDHAGSRGEGFGEGLGDSRAAEPRRDDDGELRGDGLSRACDGQRRHDTAGIGCRSGVVPPRQRCDVAVQGSGALGTPVSRA